MQASTFLHAYRHSCRHTNTHILIWLTGPHFHKKTFKRSSNILPTFPDRSLIGLICWFLFLLDGSRVVKSCIRLEQLCWYICLLKSLTRQMQNSSSLRTYQLPMFWPFNRKFFLLIQCKDNEKRFSALFKCETKHKRLVVCFSDSHKENCWKPCCELWYPCSVQVGGTHLR